MRRHGLISLANSRNPKAIANTTDANEISLRISEIFLSLQGETDLSGWPTAFVRLTGCPMRCQYCDTAYAFTGGSRMSLNAIEKKISSWNVQHVCVTGGEPLAQPDCAELLKRLCEAGYTVSLETGGAMDIGGLDPRVIRILDVKTPGSMEADKNRQDNLDKITPRDQIKFVICSRSDYEWSLQQVREHKLNQRCTVLFSPSHQELQARTLADWIVKDCAPVRFQLQLHKYLWDNKPGH